MNLVPPSFQKTLVFAFVAGPAWALPTGGASPQAPRFRARDAVRAEWARALPDLDPAKLSPADCTRWERSQRRIEAPGMPTLLPPELAAPTPEVWEAKAQAARTPQERFTALHFLNRLKSPKALTALTGLGPEDAKTWPRHLHLEGQLATARLNGAEVGPELHAFLDALQKAGKVDPVRAQAARLRLVMGGKEKELLKGVKESPGALLALMDAWNRSPWPIRAETHSRFFSNPYLHGSCIVDLKPMFQALGIEWAPDSTEEPPPPPLPPTMIPITRLFEGVGKPASQKIDEVTRLNAGFRPGRRPLDSFQRLIRLSAINALSKLESKESMSSAEALCKEKDPFVLAAALPVLRELKSPKADTLRLQLLHSRHPTARATAIEDLSDYPSDADLKALTALTWKDTEFEAQQTLIQSVGRWKLAPERQAALLKPWLAHPNWSCRYEAYQALKKLEPATPWPTAPAPTAEQAEIIKDAERLAEAGKPVRLRLRFSGQRTVILRLDPSVAPINVANLAHLARKGFFNGRRVPRVVPDFVVQMGSPYDTMDGGPGYTVRCENSLTWYGPGSVGMALSGKDTGGSQFFITTNATPHLTGKYTRVGEVEDPDQALPILDDLELGALIERIEVVNGGKGN